jgi:predicted ArsR family transcriptional regulator
MKKSTAIWSEEFKKAKNWEEALWSRLNLHGGMTIGELAENVGVCINTALRHVRKLKNKNLVYFDDDRGNLASRWHFKPVIIF